MPRKRFQSGQRIGVGQLGLDVAVGVRVIVILERHRTVRQRASAHGQIALGDEDQVSVEPSFLECAAPVYRRLEPMIGAQRCQRRRARIKLGGRSRKENLIWVVGVDRFAGL